PARTGAIEAREVHRSRIGAQGAVAAQVHVALEIGERQLAQRAIDGRAIAQSGEVGLGDRAPVAALAIDGQHVVGVLHGLEVEQDTDHVLAVYRERGHWGAIAKSNFSGLRYRAPVYRSLRELALSYFEGYVNLRGDRTLRAYSRPVNLARFDRTRPGWATSDGDLWFVAEHLVG